MNNPGAVVPQSYQLPQPHQEEIGNPATAFLAGEFQDFSFFEGGLQASKGTVVPYTGLNPSSNRPKPRHGELIVASPRSNRSGDFS